MSVRLAASLQPIILVLLYWVYMKCENQNNLSRAPGPLTGNHDIRNVHVLTVYRRHGKFRPTLMKLVSSNEESFANDTIKEALDAYDEKSDAPEAVQVLTKLKGIGPATASLLLAVHDPANVIFFADEAFYWLCSGGKKDSIKYNAKEYKELDATSRKLIKRLGVKTVDIERVAYVLMNQDSPAAAVPAQSKAEAKKKAAPVKRKQSDIDEKPDATPATRRSKRGKPS